MHQGTVIRIVKNAIVVCIWITCITDAVVVRILLTGVRHIDAIICPTLLILTRQIHIWPSIEILIQSAQETIACPTNFTLASILVVSGVFADRILITDGAIQAHLVRRQTFERVVPDIARFALTFVRTLRIVADRIGPTARGSIRALIPILASLTLHRTLERSRRKSFIVNSNVSRWAGITAESRNLVSTPHTHITWFN
uniref:Putative secreted protein n=1 Tax=Anopheles darlingi TaxID=43151 RepID=A0A2M4D671_ANODA